MASSITLYMSTDTTVYQIQGSDTSDLSQVGTTTTSGGSYASAVLNPGFLLYFPVTATSPPAAVSVDAYVQAMGTSGGSTGLPAFIARSGATATPSITTNSVHFTLSSGDTLFIPYTADLPMTLGLDGPVSALKAVSQTPLVTSMTTTSTTTSTSTSTDTLTSSSSSSSSSTTSSTSTIGPSPNTLTPTPDNVTPTPVPDNHVGAIAGGVVGGVALIAIIAAGIIFFWRRHQAARRSETVPFLSQMGQPESPYSPFYEDRSPNVLRKNGVQRHSGAW